MVLMPPPTEHIPVVAGLAYVENLRSLPQTFTVALSAETGNRYFRQAIAVLAGSGKIGYVAPEVAGHYYDSIKASTTPITCEARRASVSDHETSGVEVILDMTGVPRVEPE
jgi:hypothetical protein